MRTRRSDHDGEADARAPVRTETNAPAVANLEAELTNLRLLIRRQDAVVERLLSERAGSNSNRVTAGKGSHTTSAGKRSTRRGLLTQLAAGAAGVAAAAVYGSTKAGTASAEFNGTVAGASTAQWGIYAYPNGVTPIAASASAGVWGQADDSAPSAEGSAGVIGISNSFPGVRGQSTSEVGVVCVSAFNNGMFARTDSPGGHAGVFGLSTTAGSSGVHGSNNATGGAGVLGVAGGFAPARGVHGISGLGTGVVGESSSGIGVRGESNSAPGVEGVSVSSLGVRGRSTNFVGVVGISTGNHGLYGSTNAPGAYGIVAENLAANGPGLLITGSAPSQVFGGLQVFGVKNAVLKTQDGSFASVYCQESPEPYFEDFGRAQLVGGVANVPLEREFATLVAGGDYHVFLTPEGAAQGLYVSRRSPTGFEVRDLGNSSVAFSYRIVTKRKDIEGRRFARVSTEAAEKVAGVRAALAGMGAPGAPSPIPPAPAPFVPPVNPVVPTPPVTNQQPPNPTQPGTTGIGGLR